MEAASPVPRSLSASPRARSARFPSAHLCPFSSASPPRPSGLPLRRARSDLAFLTRSAVLVRQSTVSTVLEESPVEKKEGLLDDSGAGNGRGGGGLGGRGGGGGGGGGGNGMGEYYRRVLRVDPENPLLLRNYGAYLHEVERDLAGAEACYSRALMASPADADLLSRYGRVIWEARQEKERAEGYFERAVQAAPEDCYVLGSYANFLWDAEDDVEEETAPAHAQKGASARGSAAMVTASAC